MGDNSQTNRTNDQPGELTITRVFDAPRERVWQAWTDPEQLKLWHGPQGFTAPVIHNDLRVGGRHLYCMRGPDGKDYWSTGTYREVVPQERIVATDSFADPAGNVVPASYYGMPGDWELELELTATFEERDGKTRLTLHHTGFPASMDAGEARTGWEQSLDKLAAALK